MRYEQPTYEKDSARQSYEKDSLHEHVNAHGDDFFSNPTCALIPSPLLKK